MIIASNPDRAMTVREWDPVLQRSAWGYGPCRAPLLDSHGSVNWRRLLRFLVVEVSGYCGLRPRWIIQEETSTSRSGTGIPARDGRATVFTDKGRATFRHSDDSLKFQVNFTPGTPCPIRERNLDCLCHDHRLQR